jgi:hypothetical protein
VTRNQRRDLRRARAIQAAWDAVQLLLRAVAAGDELLTLKRRTRFLEKCEELLTLLALLQGQEQREKGQKAHRQLFRKSRTVRDRTA